MSAPTPTREHVATSLPGALVDTASLAAAASDRSGALGADPVAVVRAGSVDDVRRTLAWAHEHRVPVVPRGAGTGLAGGALADGALVLDLSGLDRILTIDPVEELAEVEPGVLTADLDAAAAAYGLMYAPDPASAAISTIGGNIATNAGGMRCVKYGVTRDAVLGLEAVLADGRVVRTGRATAKGVVGYDLTGLLVGSEGTLGVVTRATLRLRPRPAATATALATYPDVESAAAACAAVGAARLRPSLLELLDAATLGAVAEHTASPGLADVGAAVVAQTDGDDAAEATEAIERVAAVLAAGATTVERTADAARADELLAARRLALPAIEARAHALIEDICVPRSRLAEAVRGVERISAETGVAVFTFAHAGDGNLHPIVTWDRSVPRDSGVPAAVEEAAGRIFALAVELGGTLSGEHGIGTLKRAYLGLELSAEVRDVQRAVKAALDPRGVLNPGKAV
ncbi:FAD-linked oxidase C-terminal domain-containing protein [Nocardioides zeae]|uniref:FAD-linked oxidase C-terminal domain-containing protein n=1 Tax=Nocardioides imazamoxiresistens TaxID=3231893 RepID=A0ABU3Q1V2_9ACTN|nr:FAD-linked oxidase C-terminal domain-containing protein [Nocardioides zeae]MDT9595020.1 FAD-linked oxidase C-terminal domain-containing protein [Nocardioides zeae]